ncbi:MAG: indoleamine 2,3-dioxygenase [Anaerolineae bacterium]|nr:indoleamine 2,3-dioxygenase [Anaerolineae bacterium]
MNLNLAHYHVDSQRGFLPAEDPLRQLPSAYSAWEHIAAQVPALLLTERLRPELERLSPLAIEGLETNRHLQRAMLLLSVFGNAYVWAGPEPAPKIPLGVAIPLTQVAKNLGRPPIVAHASMVLNNWRRLDPTQPIALDNLDTLQLFLGGLDERWFYLTTVAIEAEGARALPALVPAIEAVAITQNEVSQSEVSRCEVIERSLQTVYTAIEAITTILLRIPEKCDPYIFFHRVRPFLAGWNAPGVIYEGVSSTPVQYAGGSAAQSSLIQALDAALDIKHVDPQSRPFLMDMRTYMPPKHRQFIEALEASPSLRQFIETNRRGNPALVEVYNHCLQALDRFRKKHIELTVRYILHQTPETEQAVGTGGTSFVPFLRKTRQEGTAPIIK